MAEERCCVAERGDTQRYEKSLGSYLREGQLFKNAYQNMRGWESALLATISKINRPPVWRSRSVLARSAGHIVLAINYPARKSNELPDHLLAGEAICLRLLPKEVDVQYSTR